MVYPLFHIHGPRLSAFMFRLEASTEPWSFSFWSFTVNEVKARVQLYCQICSWKCFASLSSLEYNFRSRSGGSGSFGSETFPWWQQCANSGCDFGLFFTRLSSQWNTWQWMHFTVIEPKLCPAKGSTYFQRPTGCAVRPLTHSVACRLRCAREQPSCCSTSCLDRRSLSRRLRCTIHLSEGVEDDKANIAFVRTRFQGEFSLSMAWGHFCAQLGETLSTSVSRAHSATVKGAFVVLFSVCCSIVQRCFGGCSHSGCDISSV